MTLLLALSVSACSESSTEKNTPLGGGSNKTATNQTDYGICGNYTPVGTDIEGNWQLFMASDVFEMLMIFEFSQGIASVQNICTMQDRSLTAHVSSPASYGNGRLEIFQSDESNESIREDGFELNCNASISRMSVPYSFQGKCLVIGDARSRDKMVLVPSN